MHDSVFYLRDCFTCMSYTVKDVIAYMVCISEKAIVDALKLMKLAFLVQYERAFSIRKPKIVKYMFKGEPVTKTEYYLWSLGPTSDDIYKVLDTEGFTVDTSVYPPPILYRGPKPTLPPSVEDRVRKVVRKYGGNKDWELAHRVMKMLNLTIIEKRCVYMGWYVDEYLRREGFTVVERDLAD